MTIRLRLTLLFAGLFFVAGLLLLGTAYRLVADALPLGDLQRRIDQLQATSGDASQLQAIETQLRERRIALREVRERVWLALIVLTALSGMVGWLMAGRMLAPVRTITVHAQRASAGNLGDRLRSPGPPDELHILSETFDAMLERLESAFELQRMFAGQVSHELRTPLSVMCAAADSTLIDPAASPRERELARTVRTAAMRSERMIDALLTLARSDSAILTYARVDLADVAGSSLAAMAHKASAALVRIDDTPLEPAPVVGDHDLLERLCDNLIANAIAYNRHDGSGWIHVTTSSSPDKALLVVANTGPAVDPSRIDELAQPFRRGDISRSMNRSGAGLGLTIVRSVVAAHGGEIDASPLPEGGFTVTVRLPRALRQDPPSADARNERTSAAIS